jgi:hypothetical protein
MLWGKTSRPASLAKRFSSKSLTGKAQNAPVAWFLGAVRYQYESGREREKRKPEKPAAGSFFAQRLRPCPACGSRPDRLRKKRRMLACENFLALQACRCGQVVVFLFF